MRPRLFLWIVAGMLGGMGACGKASGPGETIASSVLPPITVCYEPDGEPCPAPDAGEDAGEDATVLDAREDGGG